MERKRGGLLPIGEAFGGLDGLVDAVCEASPQARRHYGLGDQVDALVRASETDPETGLHGAVVDVVFAPAEQSGAAGREYIAAERPVHAGT